MQQEPLGTATECIYIIDIDNLAHIHLVEMLQRGSNIAEQES